MGMVLCEKHGRNTGPLCCKHVIEAVYGGTGPVSFAEVTCDVTGDGECVLRHLVCNECLAEYQLTPGAEVDEKLWSDDAEFPATAPVCHMCLSAHSVRDT